MTKTHRVFNETRKFRMKYNQALRAIENCACEWVEVGVSVRDLTIAEALQTRMKQTKNKDPGALPFAELPMVVFEPPIGAQAAHLRERGLAREANQFYADYLRAQKLAREARAREVVQ